MNVTSTVNVLKSLADEVRLSIVRRLVEVGYEAPSSQITLSCSAYFNLSQPTMSHHFSRLVSAGVIVERKVGTEKFYKINDDLLAKVGIDPTKL